jgi:hypothetical protein
LAIWELAIMAVQQFLNISTERIMNCLWPMCQCKKISQISRKLCYGLFFFSN